MSWGAPALSSAWTARSTLTCCASIPMMEANSALLVRRLGQGGVLDVGLGGDVLQLEGESRRRRGRPWAAVAPLRLATALLTTGTKAGSGLFCALPPRCLAAALKASACWACWPMVTWAELGDHRVGRRSPDVGEGERRLVGGHGQVLDGGRRLEDLHVARAGRRGSRGQHADEGHTTGGTEDGGGSETRAQ